MSKRIAAILFTATMLIVSPWIGRSVCRAQMSEDPSFLINYAYATWIGTGYYTVEDRDVWIFRIPLAAYNLREPTEEKVGYRLLFPLTLGFHNFETIPDSLATIAFVPGLEVSIPITKNWTLKPFGQFGFGKDFSGGSGAWIYGFGFRSLAVFPMKKWEFQLGNTLMAAGQEYRDGEFDRGFSMFELGLNVRNPWSFTFLNRETRIDTFFVHTEFIDDVDILLATTKLEKISRLFRVGATLKPEKGYKIWFATLQGIGLSYMFGDGARGIRLQTSFPF